ncbi:hypothetical protein HK405_004825 [Cladochytrium tenue]|nr:hypothetical protein HK405_004825 [Cladochytrium tenue]
MDSSSSVLSQLQHEIGELHTDVVNGHSNGLLGYVPPHPPVVDVAAADASDQASDASPAGASSPADKDPDDDDAAAAAAAAPDLRNHELFPSLPSAPVDRRVPAWRAPPLKTAAAAAAAPKKPVAGRVTERLEIPINMHAQLPPSGKKGSASDLLKLITIKTQTSVEIATDRAAGITAYLITGKVDAVKQARREIVRSLGKEASYIVHLPVSVRPHLFGSGGKNLKDLTARTGAKIDVPKLKDAAPVVTALSDEPDMDEEEQEIKITGDFEGAKMAKDEIEALIAKRTSKLTHRVTVDRVYHPFIAGPNNSSVNALAEETDTRIVIPPMGQVTTELKNPNEILIIGGKDAVRSVGERIKEQFEELKRSTQTLTLSVNKRQHRFIVGPKGAALQEILQETGCSVELPPQDDPSDKVTVRGPGDKLSQALQLVFQKSNEITIEELDVAAFVPKSTDPVLLTKYLLGKDRSEVRKIESTHNVTVLQAPISGAAKPVIEVQGKNKADAEKGRHGLVSLLKDLGTSLFFGAIEIPQELHKFVVGKGGQNIGKLKSIPNFESRLVDLIVPDQTEASDLISVVVKRLPVEKPAAPTKGAKTKDDPSVAECQSFIAAVQKEILAVVTTQADFVSESIPVPSKFHGRLIGSGGEKIKELLAPYASDVAIRFPSVSNSAKDGGDGTKKTTSAVDPEAVVLKGPKKLVAEVRSKLEAVVQELKHIEKIASHTDSLQVKKGLGKKILSGPDGGMGWLIRQVKESIAANPPKSAEALPEAAILSLRVDIETSASGEVDVLKITGPKQIVTEAKKIIGERATRLADTIVLDVKLFDEISSAAKSELRQSLNDMELKRQIVRRLIGREGKGVKAIMERHSVFVQFPEGRKKRRSKDDEADEADEVDEEDEQPAVFEGLAVIKGNKKDVDAAKKEILSFVEKETIRSFSMTFTVPKSVLPRVVGAHGSRIKSIKDEHDVRIDFTDVDDATVEVRIEGSRAGCQIAQEVILGAADELINVETVEVKIPSYLHKDVIGPAGTRIRALIDSFGGPDKAKVQFPSRGDSRGNPNVVTLKAHKRDIEKLKSAVITSVEEILSTESVKHGLVDENDEVVVESVAVSKSDVSRILGRGGDTVKDIMRKHKVVLWVAEGEDDSSTQSGIRVVGRDVASVAAAVSDIKGRLPTSKTVAIPVRVLERLATPGSVHAAEIDGINDIVKRVRAESSGTAHAELSEGASRGAEGSTIVIKGDAKAVDHAVPTVSKALAEMDKYDASARVPVSGDIRPHIIGKAGATILRIRAETGASVELTRTAKPNVPTDVVIRGTREAVDAAVEIINKIVSDQKVRLEQEKAQRVASASPTPAGNRNLGVARIDDDGVSDVTADSVPAHAVPGLASHGGKKKVPGAPASDSNALRSIPQVIQPTAYAYAGSLAKAADDEWQDVKRRGKKGEAEEAASASVQAETAPPASGTAASKKKKKKATAASAINTSIQYAPSSSVPEVHVSGVVSVTPGPLSGAAPIAFSLPNAPTPAPSPAVAAPPSGLPTLTSAFVSSSLAKVAISADDDDEAHAAPPKKKGGRAAKQQQQHPAGSAKQHHPATPPATATLAPNSTAPTVVAPTARAPTPVAPAPKSAAAPTAAKVTTAIATGAADDGWTTVNSVKKFKQAKLDAVAAAAAAATAAATAADSAGESDAAKKKKKKKNKKKKAADGAGGADDGGDSGEE